MRACKRLDGAAFGGQGSGGGALVHLVLVLSDGAEEGIPQRLELARQLLFLRRKLGDPLLEEFLALFGRGTLAGVGDGDARDARGDRGRGHDQSRLHLVCLHGFVAFKSTEGKTGRMER
jgi:hypothetical protein